MLFHVTHTHDGPTCPVHDDEAMAATFGRVLGTLTENVDEVVGAWVDGPGHTFYFVVDASDTRQLTAGMFPIIDAGSSEIRPVGDLEAMLAARAELNS